MADTAYTEGFKAGIAWEKAHRAEMAPVALSQREMTALYDDWSALGAAVEQKRIIKLLENELGNTSHPLITNKSILPTGEEYCCDAVPTESPYIAEDCCPICTSTLWLIALIKGEK